LVQYNVERSIEVRAAGYAALAEAEGDADHDHD